MTKDAINPEKSPEPYTPEYDSLLEFRIQYLQLVAQYWQNPATIFNEYKSRSERHVLKWLAAKTNSKCVPWTLDLVLQFNEDVNASNKGPVWKPNAGYGRVGWLLNEQAKFTIFLPVTGLRRTSQKTAAVAGFLRQYQLLGSDQKLYQLQCGVSGNGPAGPAALPTMKEFHEFEGVCARVLALAGNCDCNFWEKIRQHPTELLSDWLEYDLPWNMTIEFKDDEKATWDDKTWDLLSSTQLTLTLPRKPEGVTPAVEAIALAAYNHTGADHPLTCP